MIPARRQRFDTGGVQVRIKRTDAPERIHKIDRVNRNVAEIGATGDAERHGAGNVMHVPDHR